MGSPNAVGRTPIRRTKKALSGWARARTTGPDGLGTRLLAHTERGGSAWQAYLGGAAMQSEASFFLCYWDRLRERTKAGMKAARLEEKAGWLLRRPASIPRHCDAT